MVASLGSRARLVEKRHRAGSGRLAGDGTAPSAEGLATSALLAALADEGFLEGTAQGGVERGARAVSERQGARQPECDAFDPDGQREGSHPTTGVSSWLRPEIALKH